MTIRLAIVNDYEMVVCGVAEMLRGASDEIEIVELDAQRPVDQPVDIALYDTFGQASGDSDKVAELVASPLVGRVVVYTWNIDDRLVEATLARGAAAYLSKTLSAGDLAAALVAVHRGERVVSPPPAAELEPAGGDWPGRVHGLTARESEVVALITQGLSNQEIADQTRLSINSVKSYIRTSYRKMGVTSRTNAVLWGLDHGLAPDHVRIRPKQPA